MEHQIHDRNAGTGQRTRRGLTSRVLTLAVLAISAVVFLVACNPNVDKPYSTTSPASNTADDIQGLYKLIFWLSLIVFVGVQFAIVYIAMRYRRSSRHTTRPPQIHGSRRLEILWTIIPAVILLILLIPTINMLYDHDAQAQNGDIQIDVYGKQWWWEFQLANDNAQGGDSLDVVTANEIYVPVNHNVVFNLQSNNVIHSFWIPQLSGKMDVIPGHVNKLSITPSKVGEYYGECAEFCGAEHAWMRFKINVVPEEEFYAWVNNWRSAPLTSANPQEEGNGVVQAPQIFSLCLSCHRVNGSDGPPLPQGIDAPANMGPNLTMVACRETIAAGMLEMTPDNLRKWLTNPENVKPGNYMASQIHAGTLKPEEIDQLVDYIFSMVPEGGCTAANGWGDRAGNVRIQTTPAAPATPVATPVGGTPGASPVASPGSTPAASPVSTPAASPEASAAD